MTLYETSTFSGLAVDQKKKICPSSSFHKISESLTETENITVKQNPSGSYLVT